MLTAVKKTLLQNQIWSH